MVFEVMLKGTYDLDGRKEEVRSRNHWDFWVYPQTTWADLARMDTGDVCITDILDEKAEQVLKAGGKVLVTAAGKITYGKDIVQQFTPVFWNTSWFKMRPPHTTGLYIESNHPLFRNFPTDYHSDMQWWDLVNRKQVMQFTEFPADFQPIVQSIDTWFLSRKIGMLFEANVAGGRLMMTTMPLDADSGVPVIAQMRKAVITYMQSDDFRPQYTVDLQCIKDLFTKEAPKVNMYTNDSPDELKPKLNTKNDATAPYYNRTMGMRHGIFRVACLRWRLLAATDFGQARTGATSVGGGRYVVCRTVDRTPAVSRRPLYAGERVRL